MTACEQTEKTVPRPLRISVVQAALPDDWRALHGRVDVCARGALSLLLGIAAGSAAFAAVAVAGWALAALLRQVFPAMSVFLACAVAALPALLAGVAAGQLAGNLFLRVFLRMDDETRRGFATRLSLARCPDAWPGHLRNWLFTGDWLGAPAYDLRLPYARIFVEGEAPLTCRGEDALWREIHHAVSGDSLWEAGANFREISYPSQLPAWARDVEAGDGFGELERRIGRAEASEWVSHLWRRACRQWPVFGAGDYPEQARRECFEMHSLTLAGGRQALVVVLRPTAFVVELEQEQENREAA